MNGYSHISDFYRSILTQMNIKSASRMALSISVEKNRFLPRHFFTISSRPGCENESEQEKKNYSWDVKIHPQHPKLNIVRSLTSKIGNFSEFHESIRGLLKSTTVTLISGHFNAMTLQVGPPTYPAPIQQMALIVVISQSCE